MKCKSTELKMLLAAASLVIGASVLQAQNEQSGSSSSSDTTKSTMEKMSEARNQRIAQNPTLFIQQANQDNLCEIQAGQIAQEKGQSQKVKDFGKELAKDHQESNEKLLQLAKEKGIECTNKLDLRHQMKVDRLSAYSGEEFDKHFMDEQMRGHMQNVALFEQVAANCPDEDVKSYAKNTLPTLREHMNTAHSGSTVTEPAGAGQNNEQKNQSEDSPQQQQQDQQKSQESK